MTSDGLEPTHSPNKNWENELRRIIILSHACFYGVVLIVKMQDISFIDIYSMWFINELSSFWTISLKSEES